MLLEVNNFKNLDLKSASKKDYVRYLQSQTKKNKRIKLPQFHATISCNKKDKSFKELQEFAKNYMDKLGYGNNPYLVYSHNDTDNNHLHIVSTRVDNNGLKISDSFEKMKSQAIINEYYGLDYSKEIKEGLNKVNSYNFQTFSQYKSLIEKEFKTKETVDHLILYKSTFNKKIPKNLIEKLIKSKAKFYKFNKIKTRKKELRGLIIELNKEVELKNLPIIAKDYNIDILFSYKKNQPNEIFGYTVIDHNSKSVFKGSNIISLKNLKELELKRNKKNEINFLIKSHFKNTPGDIKDLNIFLKKTLNIEIDLNGNLYDLENSKRGSMLDFKIDKEVLVPFHYATRLELAKQFTILQKEDKQILSNIFKVKKTDLVYLDMSEGERKLQVEKRNQLNDYYNSTLDFLSIDSVNGKNNLREANIEIYQIGPNFFIADKEKNNIIHFDIKPHIKEIVISKGLSKQLKSEDVSIEKSHKSSIMEGLANLFDEGFEGEDLNTKGKNKNKSKQQTR
nr:relaxase/mobilization nuclease domain-containing protein [Tenacibaculum finnmarkense]